MDWDDIRFVQALGAHRTLDRAGTSLGVAPSTVFRRLNRIERDLEARLFLRGRAGYEPTDVGARIIAAGAEMADRVSELERRIAGNDAALQGKVRLTTTDTLIGEVMRALPGFRALYPGITIELVVNPTFLSLSRREADVAIRPSNAPPETLVGRRVGRLAFSVYQSRSAPRFDRASSENWIAYDDSLSLTAGYRWMRGEGLLEAPALSCDSISSIVLAAREGLGLAVLPDYLARAQDDLEAVATLPDDVFTELWVLTHPDLRNAHRIRAVTDHFVSALRPAIAPPALSR